MSPHSSVERFLERVEPGRRDALRKILVGATVYSAPVITSFSMDGLGGVAQAQSSNQTAIPTTSGWGLAALVGMIAASGAWLVGRRRKE